MLFSEPPPIYASSMMISGGRTEQHNIIAGFATLLALQVIFLGGTTEQHIKMGFGELAAVN